MTVARESSILSIKRLATREIVEKINERYVLPEDYEPPFPVTSTKEDADILELRVRFKQIRQVAKGFEYVMKTKPILGNEGEIARRSLLVDKLSKSQEMNSYQYLDSLTRAMITGSVWKGRDNSWKVPGQQKQMKN